MALLEARLGDITKINVDVIVNAAHASLSGGGGVDGAIHRAAGPQLLKECFALGGCPPGEVKITKGYCLPARYVIHAVGPVWQGGHKGEPDILASCYRRSIQRANDYHLRSMAFPCISTGVYHFPKDPAAQIAVQTVKETLLAHPAIERVVFVCFSQDDFDRYQALLSG